MTCSESQLEGGTAGVPKHEFNLRRRVQSDGEKLYRGKLAVDRRDHTM